MPSKISPRKKYTQTPYWNFFRVVLAGWLIRYPKTFFKVLGVSSGLLIVWIYNAVTR
jgi:hypothetical protein